MAVRTLDEEFLDLMSKDEELLRAEFDAIIEAGWGEPPPPPAPRRPVPPTPYRSRSHPHGQDHVPAGWQARQRAPPPRQAGDA